ESSLPPDNQRAGASGESESTDARGDTLFLQAYLDWHRTTTDATLTYQRRCTEATAEYMSTRQRICLEATQKIRAAYAEMVRAWQTAHLDEASRARYEEAARAYALAQAEACNPDRMRQLRDAADALVKAQRSALEEVRETFSTSSRDYAAAIQRA